MKPSNSGYKAAAAIRLPVERAWLYRPGTEWTYSHHAHLTWFKGRYYAMWSNGRRDEDAPGQRVLLATSTDFRTWTVPAPLLDAQPGKHSERVLTAAGFHQHAGRLVAYIGGYPHTLVHAGALHVIVSRRKEAVEVLRVKLSALEGYHETFV